LTEYLTGLDTRIGYPNQHLGKGKIEAVKSPMHATGVGLVLAGYQAQDERIARPGYGEEELAPYSYQPAAPVAAPVVPSFTPAPPVPAPAAPAATTPEPPKPGKEQRGLKFLGDITRKLKGILIDDFDDKQY